MGARYAPSVANLLMNLWEEEYIYNKKIPEIKLYRRYIDDLVILWDGTAEKFQQFLQELNNNRFSLSFTGKHNSECIEYLDLEIYKSGTSLHTRTFSRGQITMDIFLFLAAITPDGRRISPRDNY